MLSQLFLLITVVICLSATLSFADNVEVHSDVDTAAENEEERIKRTGVTKTHQYDEYHSRGCSDPGTPEFGYSFFHSRHVGSVVIHKCKSGYKLVGSQMRECKQTGHWYPGLPKCVRGSSSGSKLCKHPGMLDNGFVLVSSTHVNSVIKYKCNEGYRLVGNNYRVCRPSGEWSGNEPRCIAQGCQNLPKPQNGNVEVTSTRIGAVATYSCNDGFALVGNKNRVCRPHGQWSGVAPSCQEISCGTLADPKNGNVKFSSTSVGSTAEYSCSAGFLLVGDKIRTCQSNREWSGMAPVCRPLSCGRLESPQNGKVIISGTTPGSVATYSCNQGFTLMGQYKRTCQVNGEWSGSTPNCRPISCQSLSAPNNGQIQFSSSSVSTQRPGDKATYSCFPGFSLLGTRIRVCQQDGTYSGQAPSCNPISCGNLRDPPNGQVELTGVRVDDKAVYSCNRGFVLQGATTRTCQFNGAWNGQEPICRPVDCGHLSSPSDGQVSVTTTKLGGIAKYRCNDGFKLVGTTVRRCLANGQWSKDAPTCKINSCGELEDPQNGRVRLTGTSVGSTANYFCNRGFVLEGLARRICRRDATWSGTAPTCRRITCESLDDPENGQVTILGGSGPGSVAVYKCSPGFELVGDRRRVCGEDGRFSSSAPICRPIICEDLDNPANGRVQVNGRRPGAEARYTCDPGFRLSGQKLRVCQDDGSFSGQAPTCEAVICEQVPPIENGQVSVSGTRPGAVATYNCNSGFSIVGQRIRICGNDGTFSGQAPICQRIDCGPLDNINNGHVSFISTSVGAVASYTCDNGFRLEGEAQRTCQQSGQWSGVEPTCTIVDCGVLTPPQNGDVIFSSTAFRSTASYRCRPGFRVVGTETRICQVNGEWSSTAPVCKPLNCVTLNNPENGFVSVSGSTVGAIATYSCNPGFELAGRRVRICRNDGQYSGVEPICRAISCGELQNPLNGVVNFESTTVSSTATYSCNKGFVLSGLSTRVCQPSGEWSGEAPTCIIVNCGELRPIPNGDVTFASTGFGSIARYSCDFGFTLVGSNTRTCQLNGEWSEKEPFCRPIECGPLDSPDNGIVRVEGTTVGSVAKYTCNPGFKLSGSDMRTCQATGEWSGSTPVCQSIDCGSLPDPEYGTVKLSGTTTGSLATYKCNKGFRLTGSTTRVCLNTGEWSLQAPTCEPEDCGPLDDPKNGKVDASGTAFWDTATYTCNPGFDIIGESIRTCQENGQWSGVAPFCQSATCELLSSPKNGRVSFTGVTINSEATYTCFPGFILIGYEIRTCQNNGQWSGQEPHCRAVSCGPLDDIENGQVIVSGSDVFSIATYTCSEGFGLVGVSSRICETNGVWSDSPPVCEPADCGQLESPANGMVETTGTKFYDTAVYSCMPGYRLQGDDSRTCSENGKWTGTAPICIVIDCGKLQSPANGRVEFSSTSFRSVANYFCDEPFELVGDHTRLCQADGQWSGEAPTCQSVTCSKLTAPANGELELTQGNLAGSIAYYSCNQGFKLVGDKERKCRETGEWSGTEPTCQGLHCEVLDDIENGAVSLTGTTVSSIATYICNKGFDLIGKNTRECLSNGVWSGVEPLCQAVGCGPLDPPQNGIVVFSGISVGDTATYNCKHGFQLIGAGTRLCQANGQWSGEAPTCSSIDCGPLTDPSNGKVTFDGASVGSSASYTCNEGYILSGNQRRQCLRTGEWTGSDPICRIINCGPLSDPTNGKVRVPSSRFGSNARYSCFTGFTLVGLRLRPCQLDGRWAGNAPICEVVRCTVLPKPANGLVTITGTTVGSKASYSCDRGFELSGKDSRSCNSDGTWSGTEPVCRAISCGTLIAPVNGQVTYTTSTVGSVATYSCMNDYLLVGTGRRTCQDNGEWSGSAPVCNSKEVDCGTLPDPNNGQVLLYGTKIGDSATYTCFVGFSLSGADIRYCQENGQWSGVAPRCNPNDCPRLTAPENGELRYIGSGFGELVRYSCFPGYTLVGAVSRTCKSDGQWSGAAPICRPKSTIAPPTPSPGCGDPGVPANGRKIGDSYSVGSIVYYECNTGFRLVGPRSRLCRFDGKWTDTLPSCVGNGQCVGDKKAEDSCGQLCSCVNGYLTDCCRLRHDFASYSKEEKERYINAVTTVSTNPAYKSKYVTLLEKYKSSFDTPAQESDPQSSQFFVWNRFFLLEYEDLLREVDCRITMPYYDWTILNTSPYIHPVYDDTVGFGKSSRSSDNCVSSGPFNFNEYSLIDSAGGGCLKREYSNMKFPSRALIERDVLTRPASEFSAFQRSLQLFIHTNVRCFIGGTMCTTDAANDPLFPLHLTMLDYLFSRWQSFDDLRLKVRYSTDNSPLALASDFTVAQFHDNSNLPNDLAVCYAEPRVKNHIPPGLYFLTQSFSDDADKKEDIDIACIAHEEFVNSGQSMTADDEAFVNRQCSYGSKNNAN
ncbi:PREDICTED: sushi, von Willebrand factor type A, EGF and pentraxin domain-containing protein 1-like isoform X2 [Amphimedon queenslandica]|uniref:Sushi domain-containing protein n=1 Tax=Amphimedon queenslandica TaxID=400682 RepID=A0AAN0IFL7_AMPQE|nr:PREDICTED: sushi, von Willebrand factor type A, EGF and pentraxin domain-containing protein 1-like isoform X2 [Amphimedon queenslandica]|eukprot:XP_003387839.1 PREDICTED: sushi, von Willebrand factor type A, EGF and pentraxin domain-containing protein 1-like isoform X2 [Amphimedon queenslandica]